MSRIPYLAAHREKRAGKVEAFDIVKRAANGGELSDADLAALYSFFLPPATKKIKNAFEWAALVCDAESSYAFCKYVRVSDGCTAAANTKVAHVVFSNMGHADGWYDVHAGAVGDDVAIMPDVFKAMAEAGAGYAVSNFSLDALDIADTATGLAYVLPWSRRGVNKNYLDAAFKAVENPVVTADTEGERAAFMISGTVGGQMVAAIIMPFEMPRYADADQGEP